MDKRHLHHVWRYLRLIHPWYFLVLTVIFGFVTVVSLRQNNQRMVELRDAVYVADKENGDVEGALKNLRQYIYGHMNTSLTSGRNAVYPPIQLKYTYERLQQRQQQALGQDNGALYGQAQQSCNNQGQTTSAQQTISCIENYMSASGVELADVPDALYKFDFMSAKWSPDRAGWSLVLTVLSSIAFLVSSFSYWVMKQYL